jgi:Fe2+ transport system protein B
VLIHYCLGPFDLDIYPTTFNVVVSQRTITQTAVISENRDLKFTANSLMFVPCIALLGIIAQHCALIITPLFITQAPTCFGAP